MVKRFEGSIVRIQTEKGVVVGAGFLVSENHVVTCAHVVEQALGPARDLTETPTGEVRRYPYRPCGLLATSPVRRPG